MPNKKTLIAVAAVFVTWAVMDFVIHGIILQTHYASAPTLFRPQAEMKMALMYVVVLLAALAFVSIFANFFQTKSVKNGLCYGLWYGFGVGIGMGYGTYSVMPIPYVLALGWFLGCIAESAVAGMVAGAILRE